MKLQTKVVLFSLFAVPMVVGAQSATDDRGLAQETQVRGYWADPATDLMWTARDNGKDISWKAAVKYCRDLRLAGYSDWRLANIGELQAIFDQSANAPGRDGQGASTWHVRGNLYLTGYQWSSNYRTDDRGRNSGYSWYFDFNEGRSKEDPISFPYSYSLMRALCVRSAGK